MKHILLAIAFCAYFVAAHSQDSESFTDKKNELNIGFFNAFELNNVSDFGIGYKRMAKNGAWRFGTSFGLSTSNADNDYSGILASTYYNFSPRVGHEWHQNFNRLQLQYGADLVTKFFKRTMEEENDDPVYYRFQEWNDQSYGIRPFLGLKVFITPSISLSTETFLDMAYSITTIEEINNSSSNAERVEKSTHVRLGPLGVFSINFHF